MDVIAVELPRELGARKTPMILGMPLLRTGIAGMSPHAAGRTRGPQTTAPAPMLVRASVRGRGNVCQREVNFSGAATHLHIDMNHGQASQAPALGRPRLEVVGNGNGPARVSS